MSKPRESAPQRTRGWTSDTEVVREFDVDAAAERALEDADVVGFGE